MRDPKGLLPGVHWELREKLLELDRRLQQAHGLTLVVRSGRRTCREQNELYGIGRTYNLDSPVVTHAQGCRSWHVLGRAVDADPVDVVTGEPRQACADYTRAGEIWEHLGGEWGGRWTQFGPCGDAGHFQWRGGLTMDQACPNPDDCAPAEAAIETERPFNLAAMLAVISVLALGLVWVRTRD